MNDEQRTRLQVWLDLPMPRSRWAFRAREAINGVVKSYAAGDALAVSGTEAMMRDIERAYPFGQRSHHPYKVWRGEVNALRNCLVADLPAPTDEDHAACEVAIDLVETGETEAALKLLDEQAPRRLNRECPACAAKIGVRCFAGPKDSWADGEQAAYLVVPHLARVAPTKANGPLFGARP